MSIRKYIDLIEAHNKSVNEYNIAFSDIKKGMYVYTYDSYVGGKYYEVLGKAQFPNGMLALKVRDKTSSNGYSLVNFLEVEKLRRAK